MKTKRANVSMVFLIFLATIFIILGIYMSNSSFQKDLGEGGDQKEEGTEELVFSSEELIERFNNPNFEKYSIESKNLELDYTLRGEKKVLDFIVYKGVYDYLAGLPREITTIKDVPTLTDFKYRNLEEEVQKDFLLDLVVAIQNLALESKEDQVRIAISIVQNMPYGFSDKNLSFSYGSIDIGYTRYPYETLYDQQGLCGEKSELLVFLLKEIGYDAVFLRYFKENHEVVGIKCPTEYALSKKDSYCFVEATRPSIMTDSFGSYQGIGTLDSLPVILDTSDNNKNALSDKMYEYQDARDWVTVNKALNSFFGFLNKRNKDEKKELEIKYGL